MKAEGYDFTPLLSAGYIILRRHDDHVLKIALREWLDIILNECKRDQMSLQFVLWKHGITMKYLDDFIDPHLFDMITEFILNTCRESFRIFSKK